MKWGTCPDPFRSFTQQCFQMDTFVIPIVVYRIRLCSGTTRCTIGGGLHYPGAVATVPGLGIVVRQAYRKGLRVR